MSEKSAKPNRFVLYLAAGIYWAFVLLIAALQLWVICNPYITACPTMFVIGARAIGVLALGLAVFVAAIWLFRRFPTIVFFAASVVIAAALVALVSIVVVA